MSDRKITELQPGRIDPLFKWQWCQALRGGEYKQHMGTLVSKGAYCCIGVGAIVAGVLDKMEFKDTNLAAKKIGLDYNTTSELISLNDARRKTFHEIADWIEENL